MAIFHLDIRPVARSRGRTATAAAAYRAGERIRDERTGALYNHSGRQDVLHKEIFLPSRLDRSDSGMEWARDRSTLWNRAESAEPQRNSRVAREYQTALPAELSAAQRIALARRFSREIADRYNVAVDLAIHAPRPEGDPRNFHAHLLATTREVTPEGLGAKTGLDMEGEVRSELGLPPSRQEFRTLRARWAELTNAALKEANIEARIDHRTLEAQGIDREPQPHLPWAAIATERRGERSEVAERIREEHRARVAAREQRHGANGAATAERSAAGLDESAAALKKGVDQAAERSAGSSRAVDVPSPGAGGPKEPRSQQEPRVPLDMEARRRQAVQNWLKHRAGLEQGGRGHGNESSRPLSMEEIRQRAVAAWRSLRARGEESRTDTASRRDRHAGADREAEQAHGTPGLGDDFSG